MLLVGTVVDRKEIWSYRNPSSWTLLRHFWLDWTKNSMIRGAGRRIGTGCDVCFPDFAASLDGLGFNYKVVGLHQLSSSKQRSIVGWVEGGAELIKATPSQMTHLLGTIGTGWRWTRTRLDRMCTGNAAPFTGLRWANGDAGGNKIAYACGQRSLIGRSTWGYGKENGREPTAVSQITSYWRAPRIILSFYLQDPVARTRLYRGCCGSGALECNTLKESHPSISVYICSGPRGPQQRE